MLVDVREPAEVERLAFDVPGVLRLPLSELARRLAELPRDRDLVLACQSGPRSLEATGVLMQQGYTRVANLEGGLFKWAGRGLPITGARQPVAADAAAPGR